MSGDMHSGVQDVAEPRDHHQARPDHDNNNLLSLALCSQKGIEASTASNTSDGSLCCDICNIRVTSAKILQRHLEGRKHKSRAERRGKTFYCDLCDVTANSEIQLNIHLSSSKHKSRVAREEYKEFFDVSSYSKSMYVLLFAIFCILLNLVILVKVAL